LADSAGKRKAASSRCGHGPLARRLQAHQKRLDGDVARLRSGQYQKGGSFAPCAAAANGDPRARALVALDLTLLPLAAPPLPLLGAGPFHAAAAGGSFGLVDGAGGRFGPAPSLHDGAALPSFVAFVHAATLGGDGDSAAASWVADRRAAWLALALPHPQDKAADNAAGQALAGQFVRVVFQSSTARVSHVARCFLTHELLAFEAIVRHLSPPHPFAQFLGLAAGSQLRVYDPLWLRSPDLGLPVVLCTQLAVKYPASLPPLDPPPPLHLYPAPATLRTPAKAVPLTPGPAMLPQAPYGS
jgi:hypothetical protein